MCFAYHLCPCAVCCGLPTKPKEQRIKAGPEKGDTEREGVENGKNRERVGAKATRQSGRGGEGRWERKGCEGEERRRVQREKQKEGHSGSVEGTGECEERRYRKESMGRRRETEARELDKRRKRRESANMERRG